MFEISAKKGLRDLILGREEKTSDLAAHFSRNSGAANTVLFTIQTFNEHSRMAKLSEPHLRGRIPYAMKRHKSISPMLRNVSMLRKVLCEGTYHFGRLSTLKTNIFSTRKLKVF